MWLLVWRWWQLLVFSPVIGSTLPGWWNSQGGDLRQWEIISLDNEGVRRITAIPQRPASEWCLLLFCSRRHPHPSAVLRIRPRLFSPSGYEHCCCILLTHIQVHVCTDVFRTLFARRCGPLTGWLHWCCHLGACQKCGFLGSTFTRKQALWMTLLYIKVWESLLWDTYFEVELLNHRLHGPSALFGFWCSCISLYSGWWWLRVHCLPASSVASSIAGVCIFF